MLGRAIERIRHMQREEVRMMNMRNATRSEDTEQIAVIQWAQYNMNRYPELKWLHHIPNGGSRNRLEAMKLKQMGVKAGVSDFCLPYPKGIYCGLYIEMKFGSNRQQDTQKEFLADMAAAGHFVATCYSAEAAIGIITEYCNLSQSILFGVGVCIQDARRNGKTEMYKRLKKQTMNIPNNSILKDGITGGTGK